MPISNRWFQGAVVTYLIGFTVLGILAYLVYRDQPPVPREVVAGGKIVFTRDDVVNGMNVFQRYGLMEYGSVYGHGAYLGPDFTAEYLHKSSEFLVSRYQGASKPGLSAWERVAAELHQNSYDPSEDRLRWSEARAQAHESLIEYYRTVFQSKSSRGGARQTGFPIATIFAGSRHFMDAGRRLRTDPAPVLHDNWPPDRWRKSVTDAIIWALSRSSLLGGTAWFYFFGRYDWLGWGAGDQVVSV
jgi:nitric oxide reductase subunit B